MSLYFRVQDDCTAQLAQHVNCLWGKVQGEGREVREAVQVPLSHELQYSAVQQGGTQSAEKDHTL